MASSAEAAERGVSIVGNTFHVPKRFSFPENCMIGAGNFGLVALGYDTLMGRKVTIKRIRPCFDVRAVSENLLNQILVLFTLRNHPNIIRLNNLCLHEPKNELYMILSMFESDLSNVVKSNVLWSEYKIILITQQIFSALEFIHDAGIIHCDLRSNHILLCSGCKVKVDGFSKSRYIQQNDLRFDNTFHENKAPELLVNYTNPCSTAVDIWSVGCIIAEIWKKKPIFQARNFTGQIVEIFTLLGYNQDEKLEFSVSEACLTILKQKCQTEKKDFKLVLPEIKSDACIDLLYKIFEINPSQRISAKDALQTDFFKNKSSVIKDGDDLRDNSEQLYRSDDLFISPSNKYISDHFSLKKIPYFNHFLKSDEEFNEFMKKKINEISFSCEEEDTFYNTNTVSGSSSPLSSSAPYSPKVNETEIENEVTNIQLKRSSHDVQLLLQDEITLQSIICLSRTVTCAAPTEAALLEGKENTKKGEATILGGYTFNYGSAYSLSDSSMCSVESTSDVIAINRTKGRQRSRSSSFGSVLSEYSVSEALAQNRSSVVGLGKEMLSFDSDKSYVSVDQVRPVSLDPVKQVTAVKNINASTSGCNCSCIIQ